jgi:hypothetical protein
MNHLYLPLASGSSAVSLSFVGECKSNGLNLALLTCWMAFATLAAQAQVVPIDYYRTGEADAGNTAPSAVATSPAQDSLGTKPLTLPGGTFYRADVAASTTPVPHTLHAPAQTLLANEVPFLAENQAAMTTMMKDMSVQPTGDVDRDFVAMMVPHHQGAIDMALVVLRYGHNEKVRRLAQEIIVTQQEEIAAMRLAVGEDLPPSVPSPTQPSPRPDRQTMSRDAATPSKSSTP